MSVAAERMMNRVLLPNLFFEEELQTATNIGSTNARQLAAELGPVMGLLAHDNVACDSMQRDQSHRRLIVVVSDEGRPDELPKALQGIEFLTIEELAGSIRQESRKNPDSATVWESVPWGWSDAAITTLQKTGRCFDTPDIDVVRSINSRQFQSKYDTAIEIDGAKRINSFGKLCRSLPEVMTAIKAACEYSQRGWVIKAEFSHACRNRLRGTSAECSSEQRAWLTSRIASGECVYVEPWVERISECGLQFTVTKSVRESTMIDFAGATEMLTDETGRYRGSVVRSLSDEGSAYDSVWKAAIDHCREIAEAAAAQGYFGPLGIDCMVFRGPQDNRHWLRLSHDINGRLTMGRVALSLRGWLKPGETGYWIHATSDLSLQNGNRIDEVSCSGVRFIPTSPGRIGGRAAKIQTGLFASADSDRLKAIWTSGKGARANRVQDPPDQLVIGSWFGKGVRNQ